MTSRALVLHPDIRQPSLNRTPEARLEEAVGLGRAISLDIRDAMVLRVNSPRPATLLGAGKVEELAEYIADLDIELVCMDAHLSPIQQRNLEKAWKCKVIDRTALILEIFGERANTREGKLQVELAALNYQKSRLVRSWTHLERQRGGLGFVGGPGETQIEVDRRLIRERIAKIKKQLETVVRTRSLHRKLRQEVPFPLVALVGYTNAGKSTLFNRLTRADTLAQDALFATLDPTIRQCKLPSGQVVMLSDTVGFISDLPTDLIAAFRATLEEVCEADVILHVRDISHPDTAEQKKDVEAILKDLLSDHHETPPPVIEVHNKIDALENPDDIRRDADAIALSALTGEGTETLLNMLDDILTGLFMASHHYQLPVDAQDTGKAMAWLHQHGRVETSRHDKETGQLHIEVALTQANANRFGALFHFENTE